MFIINGQVHQVKIIVLEVSKYFDPRESHSYDFSVHFSTQLKSFLPNFFIHGDRIAVNCIRMMYVNWNKIVLRWWPPMHHFPDFKTFAKELYPRVGGVRFNQLKLYYFTVHIPQTNKVH